MNKDEYSFYDSRMLEVSEKVTTSKKNPPKAKLIDGEPGLRYHEFIFVISRIALDIKKFDSSKHVRSGLAPNSSLFKAYQAAV